jgi:hypothetical protein
MTKAKRELTTAEKHREVAKETAEYWMLKLRMPRRIMFELALENRIFDCLQRQRWCALLFLKGKPFFDLAEAVQEIIPGGEDLATICKKQKDLFGKGTAWTVSTAEKILFGKNSFKPTRLIRYEKDPIRTI